MHSLKLTSLEGLTKLPISRCHVVACDSSTVTGGDLKRETLSIEEGVALPILPPVPWHGLPTSFGPFDGDCIDIPCTRDVVDQNQVEVRVSINCEPYSSLFHTRHPVFIIKKTKTKDSIIHIEYEINYFRYCFLNDVNLLV